MNALLRCLALTASALAALTVSLAASAQAANPPVGGPGSMTDSRMGGPMGSHRMHRPPTAAEVNARLDQQKAALALTGAQEPAWQNFAAVVRRQAEARDAEHLKMLTEQDARLHAEMDALKAGTAPPAPTLTPADRALRRASMLKQQEAQQAERDEALKALLAVLTPEQKLKAETVLRSPRRGHRLV